MQSSQTDEILMNKQSDSDLEKEQLMGVKLGLENVVISTPEKQCPLDLSFGEDEQKVSSSKQTQKKEQQTSLYPIGQASFAVTLYSETYLNTILSHNITRILDRGYWKIDLTREQYQDWKDIFNFMREAHCNTINLSRNYNPRLLKMISHISFTKLNTLNLSFNMISNIEAFTHLHFGSLRMLDLENNYLTQVKALNKFYKLNDGRIVIKLDNNFLNTPSLSRMDTLGSILLNFDYQMEQQDQQDPPQQSTQHQQIQVLPKHILQNNWTLLAKLPACHVSIHVVAHDGGLMKNWMVDCLEQRMIFFNKSNHWDEEKRFTPVYEFERQ